MKKKIVLWTVVGILIVGLLLPQNFVMPVKGADRRSYNPDSFWFYPWGRSGTHKGVDIFAKGGTAINSSTKGIVLYSGSMEMGGNVVLVLGPKWRVHYYAHLDKIKTTRFNYVDHNSIIGTVGATGNAQGKPPHLHYSIMTLVPYPWRADFAEQGLKKMVYLNPIEFLNESEQSRNQ